MSTRRVRGFGDLEAEGHRSVEVGKAWPRFGPVDWLLLLVAMIWGGSYSAAKLATAEVPVLQFLVLRFGLTFVLLLPALRGLRAAQSWRAALAGATLLGINLLAIFVCETFGVSLTTASNAASAKRFIPTG